METPAPRVFVTREPGLAANVAQFGWMRIPSQLLERLEDRGDTIVVRTRDGTEQVLRRGAFRCTSYQTRAAGRLFVIHADDGRTIRLLELDGTLPPGDWDAIANEVLKAEPSLLASAVARIGIALVLGMLLGALTTGFVGGLAGLDAARLRLGSPLSAVAVVAWVAVIYWGLRRLARIG